MASRLIRRARAIKAKERGQQKSPAGPCMTQEEAGMQHSSAALTYLLSILGAPLLLIGACSPTPTPPSAGSVCANYSAPRTTLDAPVIAASQRPGRQLVAFAPQKIPPGGRPNDSLLIIVDDAILTRNKMR